MIVAKVFADGVAITDSEVAYYTAPSRTRSIIKKAIFLNSDDTPITVSVYIVSTGGSTSYTNRVVHEKLIPGHGAWLCPNLIDQVLEPDGDIVIVASVTNKIGCSISGFEIS